MTDSVWVGLSNSWVNRGRHNHDLNVSSPAQKRSILQLRFCTEPRGVTIITNILYKCIVNSLETTLKSISSKIFLLQTVIIIILATQCVVPLFKSPEHRRDTAPSF
ncbi:hypothetical protein KIL84_016189 [Mauremys mutica]|uniref:Uncharacterized protein n=1 Tax=Mauremys mutica TaxID=74926 RepID=A0A9D3WS12_9SAUR|nr:hypothetical protein KIL84_016189 [Mauremys mutica]